MSRYIIIGAGAVGAVLAAELSLSGAKVHLVGRPGAHVAAIAERGLSVARPSGVEVVRLPVTSAAHDVELQEGDVLVLAVKAQDAEAALEFWAWHGGGASGLLGADLPLITLQNGLATETAALRRFRTVYGATVGIASSYLTPGEVASPSEPTVGAIWIGRYPAGRDALLDRIARDLQAARFATQIVENIAAWKAWKLLHNVTNGLDVLDGNAAAKDALREQLVDEARSVFDGAGIEVAAPQATQLSIADVPGYERRSSTWQSFARGASSEADWLNGEVVALGRLHGVPTPVNEALARSLGVAAATGTVATASQVEALAGHVAALDDRLEVAS